MPIMNGWEFAAAFLEKYGRVTDWVEKPFNLDVLLEKIKKYAT